MIVNPNNIVEAIKIVNDLHNALNDKGINFTLYGSTLRNGIGNDIDICVLHSYRDNEYVKKKVAAHLEIQGFTQFGTDSYTGYLWKRYINKQAQALDIWIVNSSTQMKMEHGKD